MIDLGLQNASSRYLKLSDGILESEEILLVQCDNETDAESIARSGAKLKSKGGASDAVHLCLEDKTLACKYVETTNSLFLVDVAEAQDNIENRPAELRASGVVQMSQHAGLLSQLHSDLQAEFAPPIQMQARSNFIVETVRCSLPVPQVQQLLQQHCIDRATVQGRRAGKITMTWAELSSLVMASDQDITAALQSIKAIRWQKDSGDGWSLLDESLLLDALEHILLTCVEHNIQLEKFQMSGLLSALQAEDNPLSNALTLNDSCLAWHVVRLYGVNRLAFAAWDPETNTARPEFPEAAQHMGFDVQKVASGCMHAVLGRYCERTQVDPGVGKAVVNVVDIQDDWKDVFPSPHFWNECACMSEQEKIAWSSNLMLESCQGLALRQVMDETVELRVLFETRLSPSAKDRFEMLFSVKDTWTRDEIEPYLNLHDGECCGSTELLLRYSRTIRDGTAVAPIYCAR